MVFNLIAEAQNWVTEKLGVEMQLGQTEDPKLLVNGETDTITQTAAHLSKLGAAFGETAKGFSEIDVQHWTGAAADADRLEHVEDRYCRQWLKPTRPLPPPSAEQRAASRKRPNSWLPVFDPEFEKSDDAPPWAIRGRYPVDGQGRLGEFVANPDYVAGPQVRRCIRPPQNMFEYTLALFAAGYVTEQALRDAFAEANVIVEEHPDGPGRLYPRPDRRGQLVVPVYSDWWLRPRFGRPHELVPGRDLLAANNGRYKILINPRAMGIVRATLWPDGSCWRYPAGR